MEFCGYSTQWGQSFLENPYKEDSSLKVSLSCHVSSSTIYFLVIHVIYITSFFLVIMMFECWILHNNVCLIKIHNKHSSITLLRLLRIFMRQTLFVLIFNCSKLRKWISLFVTKGTQFCVEGRLQIVKPKAKIFFILFKRNLWPRTLFVSVYCIWKKS